MAERTYTLEGAPGHSPSSFPLVEVRVDDVIEAEPGMGDISAQARTYPSSDPTNSETDGDERIPSAAMQTDVVGTADIAEGCQSSPIQNLVGVVPPSAENVPDEGNMIYIFLLFFLLSFSYQMLLFLQGHSS